MSQRPMQMAAQERLGWTGVRLRYVRTQRLTDLGIFFALVIHTDPRVSHSVVARHLGTVCRGTRLGPTTSSLPSPTPQPSTRPSTSTPTSPPHTHPLTRIVPRTALTTSSDLR